MAEDESKVLKSVIIYGPISEKTMYTLDTLAHPQLCLLFIAGP